MKDYKIETTGSLWHVILSRGCYSDYEEHHLAFSANSEDEVWKMIEIYIKDNLKEYCASYRDTIFKNNSDGVFMILLEDEKRDFEKKPLRTLKDFDSDYYDYYIEIKRLEIINFDKI